MAEKARRSGRTDGRDGRPGVPGLGARRREPGAREEAVRSAGAVAAQPQRPTTGSDPNALSPSCETHFAAPYIRERRWHPSQQLRETPAGLELTLHLNNLVDITRWILSWTPHAEALHPPELRALLATAYYQAPRYPEFSPTPTPPVGDPG